MIQHTNDTRTDHITQLTMQSSTCPHFCPPCCLQLMLLHSTQACAQASTVSTQHIKRFFEILFATVASALSVSLVYIVIQTHAITHTQTHTLTGRTVALALTLRCACPRSHIHHTSKHSNLLADRHLERTQSHTTAPTQCAHIISASGQCAWREHRCV
jgi:hypothetical protein